MKQQELQRVLFSGQILAQNDLSAKKSEQDQGDRRHPTSQAEKVGIIKDKTSFRCYFNILAVKLISRADEFWE
jgi:hypothetical protein